MKSRRPPRAADAELAAGPADRPAPVLNLTLPDGTSLSCPVRRSVRARRLRLTFAPERGPELVLPPGGTLEEALAFARSCGPWLLLRRREAQRRRLHAPDHSSGSGHRAFPDRLDLPYLADTALAVRYEWRPGGWTGARLDLAEQTLKLTGAVLAPDRIRSALTDFLLRTAAEQFGARLRFLAEKFGFPRDLRLTIRLQKGRWGSCSRRSGIALNALLLAYPRAAADYVMIHELCHLKHMDHSPKFWREVEARCPDWRIQKARLRRKSELGALLAGKRAAE